MPSSKFYSARCGGLYLIYLTLTILWIPTNARFSDDPYKYVHDRPWSRTDRDVSLEFASSEQSPSYSRVAETNPRRPAFDSTEFLDRANDWYLTAASKKVPTENKNFKKLISPFYTITDRDSQEYKDMVMKSGVPYCQEISRRRADKDGNAKDTTICYKCKNPKNGATYEQCSYVSQPLSDSSDVDEAIAPPPGFRIRRSNSEGAIPGFRDADDYRRRDSPYRFNEKLFSEATEDVPAEYKNKNEKCEKVLKDSMVCMVCRDTKSNAKYEQCSYVRQPSEKTYAYSKSSSFKNPERSSERSPEGNAESEQKEETKRYDEEESKPVREYSDGEREESPEGEYPQESKDASHNCRKVQRNSQICTVCRDPRTGGNSEKCSYAYEPKDKVYKYSRSKSIGQPRGSKGSSSSKDDAAYETERSTEKPRSESDDYSKDYSIPKNFYEKYDYSPSGSYFKDEEAKPGYRQAASEDTGSVSDGEEYSSDYDKSKSESEKVSKSIEADDCETVEKDSMTCKVCKDRKTGSTSEQCSYNYKPRDKSYSYSKSKSFGGPGESGDKSYDESGRKESREPSYESRGYDYPAEKRSYDTDGDKEPVTSGEGKTETKEVASSKPAEKKVDAAFYDAFKKKAEIQKVLQDFEKEDRSKCKKLIRNKMTCYQCVDEKGFQKEECAFVAAEEPATTAEDNRETRNYPVEPTRKVPRSIISDDRADDSTGEPEVAANEKVYVKRVNTDNESAGEDGGSKSIDAYEYAEETRPIFDRALGFTLPAYMLSTSEHEDEFDRIASSRI